MSGETTPLPDEPPAPEASPSRLFIARPVATTLLMLAVMLAGLLALRNLPVAALPEVDYPTIQVTTFYPGASPEVMARVVTAPLERQFGQMSGLSRMTSTSAAGASLVTLQFSLNLDLASAEQQVQAAISAANSLLPSDLPAPPIYAKVNPADAPILTLAATSSTLPLHRVADLIDTRVAQKLSQVSGVGLVSIGGGQRPAVRVRVDMNALAAKGINIDDIRTVVAAANVGSPKGSLDGPTRAWSIDANDQIRSADAYRDLIVAWKNGAPVRIRDIGEVIDGPENNGLISFEGSQPGIIIDVRRQPGANVMNVVDDIRVLLPELRKTLPAGVELAVLTDRTVTIRASVRDVAIELGLAVVLVVAVIFLFLGDARATLVPGLSVPLSLIGTFAVMYLAGYSINTLSLMALTVATGFVVDDAIVMLENIARYVEEGMHPLAAAYRGASEIGFTIISLTISLVAVLIPLLFMGDVVGRLFREFAVTLAVSILISAVVSLTFVPMLAARVMRPVEKMGRTAEIVHRVLQRVIDGYAVMLDAALKYAGTTLLIAVLTLAVTLSLAYRIPKGFFPTADIGLIEATTEAESDISFTAMAARQRALADVITKVPDVTSVSSFVGVDGLNPTINTARMVIALKPHAERTATVTDVMAAVTRAAADVKGLTVRLRAAQELTVDSTRSAYPYALTLRDTDKTVLATWAPLMRDRMMTLPQLGRVALEGLETGPTAFLDVDRDAAARFGITQATIDNALYDAFGQRIISTIFAESSQYRVILEADPKHFDSLERLEQIHLPASGGGQVPLATFAHVEERQAPVRIDHLDQFPAVTLSFELKPGVSLGQAVEAINTTRAELGMPASISMDYQGAAAAFEQSSWSTVLLVIAAVVVMYLVLGVLYESFVHPVTILSTLPSAGLGALIALDLAGKDLDIVGIIGIVLLIGIVKKNAIMMIDFALTAERRDGLEPRAAIRRAALLRFRPILMTTLAALFGALPLMLGAGVGAELRQPLGLAIVGGLIVSQVLTLFTTPVIYLAFDTIARRFGEGGRQREAAS
jgi:multidrug efflux pump